MHSRFRDRRPGAKGGVSQNALFDGLGDPNMRTSMRMEPARKARRVCSPNRTAAPTRVSRIGITYPKSNTLHGGKGVFANNGTSDSAKLWRPLVQRTTPWREIFGPRVTRKSTAGLISIARHEKPLKYPRSPEHRERSKLCSRRSEQAGSRRSTRSRTNRQHFCEVRRGDASRFEK